ncbi:MAG: sulfatase [Phycisphaerae bacterium]|nr:sulfatase [Phycisphaerae bacterium]
MKRNWLIHIMIWCLLCGLASTCAWAGTGNIRPNIILIVADDLGYGDVGFNGSLQIRTPNLDALASQGVRFTQGYVSSAVCSPSRAGLLTGRNQPRFGYDNNLAENQRGYDPEYAGLPVTEKTIADSLKPLGYVNALIGKWHLGTRPQFHPHKRGFDVFWGFLGGGHDYFKSSPNGAGYQSPIECSYKQPRPITYITDDIGHEAVDFIKGHTEQPFFLYVAFNAPHAPMQALDQDLALYTNVKEKKRRTYCAMVHRLDVNIGAILAAVESAGMSQRTLVVFISDNGGPVDSNASINAPLNGQKGILLEGGIRVPFVMKWPGVLKPGSVYDPPVWSLDLLPTFVKAARGTITEKQDLDGVDLLPYLTNQVRGVPHETMQWRFTISAAIRSGQWKLIRLPDRLPMLYDLSADISEQHDLAIQNLGLVQSMLKDLGQWDVRLPHPVCLEGAVWKRRQLALYDTQYPLVQPEAN